MKKLSIGIVFIIVCIGLYIFLVDYKDKENINTSKIENQNRDIKEKANDEIITDSKVLKGLYLHLKERNWDAFDEVYKAQIKLLREDGNHTLFYRQFKDFFIENNLSEYMQIGILSFLVDASTKESMALIFEMFDEGIVSNKEVEFNVVTYLANSISIVKEDPSIDFKGVVESLQHGYQTTENDYLRRGTAVLLARYETPESEVILFRDYMEAQTPEKKRAAYEGLMSLGGTAMLPRLSSYLKSNHEDVRKTSGMILANMASDEAIAVLSEWVMEEATIESVEDIKRWYAQMIKTDGHNRVSKSIKLGKIRSEELRTEIEMFLEEQLEKENNSVNVISD